MNTLDIVKADYQRFPYDQTYSIYADNVYFKDPLNEFRGVKRYQEMIGIMTKWLKEMELEVQEIAQTGNIIHTKWRLSWTTPLPWQPRITIPGRSELTLDKDNKIISHIDFWNCSKWEVIKQHF